MDAPSTPPSNLRKGRFADAGNTPRKMAFTKTPPYDHKFKRVYAEGSRILSSDEKHVELTMAIRGLVKEGKKVDESFVLEPIGEGETEPVIRSPNDVPLNQTEFGANVKLPSNVSFEKRRPWGKKADEVEEEDMLNPEIYFSIVISSDKDPDYIFDRIRQEWRKQGGNRLQVRELSTHDVKGAVALYLLHNMNHEGTIIAEARRMLVEARDAQDLLEMDYIWGGKEVPHFILGQQVPHIPGQDTSGFDKMPWQMKNARKALHIKCDAEDVKHLQGLMRAAKDQKLVQQYWGNQAKPSDVLISKKQSRGDEKSRAYMVSNVKSFTRKHVNYHSSMIFDNIPGIWDLDVKVAIHNVSDSAEIMGLLSLRQVLYKQIKLSDGHSMFGELHQQQALSDVEAVIPNIKEAEETLLMMKKNVVAYLQNYLVDGGMDEGFVKTLLTESCDPSLFHTARHCKWDKDKKILTTPEDEEEAKTKALEEAAWYNDAFGDFMDKTSKKKGQPKYTDPENIYDLDGVHSVKTINQKPGSVKGYGGSPGAPTFQVGGNKKQPADKGGETIEIDDDVDDDMSALSNLSRDELIARLKEARVSPKPTGSAPDSGSKRSHSKTSGDEESSSSSDSSSDYSSSSGSSVESVEVRNEAQSG
jgi:hypothetical protein